MRALFEHWAEQPPVELLAAAWMGWKAPSDAPKGPLKLMATAPPRGIQALRAQFPGGVIRKH